VVPVPTKAEVQERRIILVALLFAASGCAASIHQLVWFQLLSLVIGASSISVGVLLATYMGGLCLGSLLSPQLVSPRYHPLRILALVELGIAVLSLAVLYEMPSVARIYAAWAAPNIGTIILRALVASICLLPPTMLMGATLPLVARGLEASTRGIAWLGTFYAANIGGAVAGSLIAGFYLLRVHDIAIATFAASGFNIIVACASIGLATMTRYVAAPSGAHGLLFSGACRRIYVTTALSGMTALSAEVLWTRHLSLLLGATVYTFSLILAVFLLGLGIGSGIGSAVSRLASARTALGCCQLLLCLAMTWAAYAMTKSLPYWPVDVTLPATPWVSLQLDLIRTIWAIFPAALLWGASFPLALAAATYGGQDPGQLVGGLYAANTLGAITGALATSFVLVVWLGSRLAQQLLILIAACAGLLLFAPFGRKPRQFRMKDAVVTFAGTAGAIALVFLVPALPWEFVAYGRFTSTLGRQVNVIYMGEGLTTSVAVSQDKDGHRTYHNNGKPEASSHPQDKRVQRMLGHLTTLVPKDGRTFLVIGLGAGITAGAVSVDPAAERVVIAEIEPLAVEVASKYFVEENFRVVNNPKAEIRIDDGRHYVSTTRETFDGITVDPLDPWLKGAAALYTWEFWELCRSRLNPGGVVTVFIQLYETTEEAVKSQVAAFFKVFPNAMVFANTVQAMGYDLVLLGRIDNAPIDIDDIHKRLEGSGYEPVVRSLKEVGFDSAADLFGTYVGHAPEMSAWLDGAIVNSDRNLRLQYLAARGLNVNSPHNIFSNMMAGNHNFPENLFAGSAEFVDTLRQMFRARQGNF
jgi:spermidine synthase